ncbi:ABC transporter substrate-binding protein [Mycetocola sp. JXN-3]|uniref:ABC transporter substrate-binding protein n=1 Tax=Mycetocola sp. JXN-3 TaxID=2116510 RepID=UPI0021021936|nr:extracellular solute-binding protein [Mycetocola sp. JXN-3]
MKNSAPTRTSPRKRAVLRASVLGLVAALSVGLAACSTGPSGSSGLSAWSTTADRPYVEPSIKDWNAAHPDDQIKDNYFGTNDFKDKIRTAVSSDQAPTLVYNWGGGTLKSYVKAGLVRDLTSDLSGKTDWTQKIVPSVAQAGVVDGKTYAVPMSATAPVVLYFNKDVLKKAGVEAPQTWDELIASIPKFKAAGVAPISLGGGSKWPYLMWIEYLVDRIGGPEVFQNIVDNKPDAWSDPAVIKAGEMIRQLVDAGGFADGYASVSADTNADLALMVTGRAGMLLQGSWAYSGIKDIDPKFESDGKLGYAAFPAVDGGKGDPKSLAGNPSVYWSISAKATDAQAKKALDYITSDVWNDSYVKTMTDAGNIPPLTDAATKVKGDFATTLSGMVSEAPSFQQSWDLALSPAASAALWTQLDLLFGGTSTPKQFSDNMNKTLGK